MELLARDSQASHQKQGAHNRERSVIARNTHDHPAQGFNFRCDKQPQTAHGSGTGKLVEAAWNELERGKWHCAGGQPGHLGKRFVKGGRRQAASHRALDKLAHRIKCCVLRAPWGAAR